MIAGMQGRYVINIRPILRKGNSFSSPPGDETFTI